MERMAAKFFDSMDNLRGIGYQHILATLVSLILSYLAYIYMQRLALNRKLHAKIRKLVSDRESILLSVVYDAELDKLCDLSTHELAIKLRAKEIDPCNLLLAFQQRSATLIKQNCIAEVIVEASDTAKQLPDVDDSKSSLYGIPISIKEHLKVRGYETPGGLVKNLGIHATEDCVLVNVLKNAGAIPFVTTSMPPAGLSINSSNAIYGCQVHPLDNARVAGGSSGGEALLILGGGSPLGFGTDIAGSLRIPAAFCGISSLKPTFKRISQFGLHSNYRRSVAHLNICLGPMAKKVRSLVDAMRTLSCQEMFDLDPTIPPMPFDEVAFSGINKKSLVIGCYTNLVGKAQISVVPAVERAVNEVRVLLESQGHIVVDYQPPNADFAAESIFRCLLADGGKNLRASLNLEPLPKHMWLLYLSLYLPSICRFIFARILCTVAGESLGCIMRGLSGCDTSGSVLSLLDKIAVYQQEFADSFTRRDQPIDVLIAPVFAYPAPRADIPELILDVATPYTAIYNLVDYPAGVVPVSRVTSADVEAAERAESAYRANRDRVNATVAHMQRGSEGLPLTVQVIGRPMQEETVLRVMQEIESAVNYW